MIECCRYCSSGAIIGFGKTRQNVFRYKCKDFGRIFSATTNTIFDRHKIPISEWIEFILAIIRYDSFRSIGRNLRISESTIRYWTEKLFLLVEDIQSDIVLEGYIDETIYSVRKPDIIRKKSGQKYRGFH